MDKQPSLEECISHDIGAVRTLANNMVWQFSLVRRRKEGHRSSVFVWELIEVVDRIAIIAQAEAQGDLHPDYALEKLAAAQRYIDSAKEYFEAVKKVKVKP